MRRSELPRVSREKIARARFCEGRDERCSRYALDWGFWKAIGGMVLFLRFLGGGDCINYCRVWCFTDWARRWQEERVNRKYFVLVVIIEHLRYGEWENAFLSAKDDKNLPFFFFFFFFVKSYDRWIVSKSSNQVQLFSNPRRVIISKFQSTQRNQSKYHSLVVSPTTQFSN